MIEFSKVGCSLSLWATCSLVYDQSLFSKCFLSGLLDSKHSFKVGFSLRETYMITGKTIALTVWTFVGEVNAFAF